MGVATAAERQRRRRAHIKGDHTACLPQHCAAAGHALPPPPPLPPPPTPPPATTRGERAAGLWADMVDAGLPPMHRVLLDEACRVVNRLDTLDALLSGKDSWLDGQGEEGRVVVVVDALLAEARQHAVALRGLVAELRQAMPSKTTRAGGQKRAEEAGNVSSLAARAARRRKASG